eukprot:261512-Pleurochrysis_carterae.AAC.1
MRQPSLTRLARPQMQSIRCKMDEKVSKPRAIRKARRSRQHPQTKDMPFLQKTLLLLRRLAP